MNRVNVYNTLRWRAVRSRVLERDGNRCSVARLIGGECSATLHVHHVRPVQEGGSLYDLENLLTVCDSHHPVLEAFRRRLLVIQDRDPERPNRCPHFHRTEDARRACEARLARARSRVA